MKIEIKHIDLSEQNNITGEPGILELEDKILRYKSEMYSDYYNEEQGMWVKEDYQYVDMYILKHAITGAFMQYSGKNECWKVAVGTARTEEEGWFFFETKAEAEGVLKTILEWLLDEQIKEGL